MSIFRAIIERDDTTALLVGHIPGWPGAHTQGNTLAEVYENLAEVVLLLTADLPTKRSH